MISVTKQAWKKIGSILQKTPGAHGFLFGARGGGCNGFNYKLETIDEKKFDNLTAEEPSPIVVTNSNTQVVIEPMSEMLLLGTSIDFIEENYSKNIFESKFIFTPKKDFATSCGCGISFSPK